MPWVVTRLCRDCVDQSCVDVCPVDCIYEYTGDNKVKFPDQLFIHPDECIDCGACEPECPWEAIYEDVAVPEVLKEDIELNAAVSTVQDELNVPDHDEKERPTPEQVAENRVKWGIPA
ncbi:MAG: 4Fe-4S binding protein [Myxococcota bacterium]